MYQEKSLEERCKTVLHHKYTLFVSLLSLQHLKVFHRGEMTTKEQITEQLGWLCLQKGKACLFIISEFHCISKTVRKGQAFMKSSIQI